MLLRTLARNRSALLLEPLDVAVPHLREREHVDGRHDRQDRHDHEHGQAMVASADGGLDDDVQQRSDYDGDVDDGEVERIGFGAETLTSERRGHDRYASVAETAAESSDDVQEVADGRASCRERV